MHAMSDDECRAFLSAAARAGKLATTRADGRPHVVPIWFVLDADGAIRFTTGAATVKARNLPRDPRAMLRVDDSAAATRSPASCSCGCAPGG